MLTDTRLPEKAPKAKFSPPVEFLTGPQVQARYQKSHVTIWRWVRDPALGFPAPIQINRLNYWRLSDLEAWETAQALQGAA